jgi:uncharacterized membrane protein YkgB
MMDVLVDLSRRHSTRLLRVSLAVVLAWIGSLKFADPSPVVGLLQASFPFLATNAVVYALGAAELAAAVLVLTGIALPWTGLLLTGLFSGTLAIFLIAPAVTYGGAGFPFLGLAGEFLLKDLVLFAASFALIGTGAAVRPVAARA